MDGHCLYRIFLPFSVSLGSAAIEVLEAGTSSLASLAAASTTASLVLEGFTSGTVLEAIVEVDMAVVVITVVLMAPAIDVIEVGSSDSEIVIEVGTGVGVGPTVDMDVSEGVAISDVIEGVVVVISTSASEYSVGERACVQEPSESLYQAPSSECRR